MCLAASYWARLERIYFANTKVDAAAINFDDDFIYREFAKEPAARTIPMTQLMRDEAMQAFKEWGSSTGKIPY